MKKNQYLVLFFFLIAYIQSPAQKRWSPRDRTGSWEVGLSATHLTYSGIGQRTGYGVTADYFLTNHISIRGGLVGNSNYLRFSPAPAFWALLVDGPTSRPHSHYHSSKGNPLLGYLICLTMSDGFAYNFEVNKNLYIAPYIAPLQMQMYGPQGSLKDAALMSSVGLGVKGYFNRHYVYYLGAEYSQSFLFKSSGQGYSMNASIGYVFP